MKTIYTINANRTMVGPGVWNIEAEAMVTGPDTSEEVYVYVSHYEGLSIYKVDDKSMIDECADISEEDDKEFDGDALMEMYEDLMDTTGSAYHSVFKVLDKLLDSMGNEIK